MMRSHLWSAVCAILFSGFASVASSGPTQTIVDDGQNFTIAVLTFSTNTVKCYLESPNRFIRNFKPNDESDQDFQLLDNTEFSDCRVMINNVNVKDAGVWTLTAEDGEGNSEIQQHNLTVNPSEEPSNTPVEYLPDQNIVALLGTSQTITIADKGFLTTERCFIITPHGQRISFDDLSTFTDLKFIDVISSPQGDGCSIEMKVDTVTAIGNWTLVSEGTRGLDGVERRLNFTIDGIVIVSASARNINVIKGNDFFVRLERSIYKDKSTCRLIAPNREPFEDYEVDPRYEDKCGYKVMNAAQNHQGEWEIQYRDVFLHKAFVNVNVHDAADIDMPSRSWTKDRSLNLTIGPENAVYCRIVSPSNIVYYEEFGRCKINLDRVTSQHEGVWKVNMGLPGRVQTEDFTFTVEVVQADPRPTVTMEVIAERPTLTLSCSVDSPHPIRACKFRDPSGRILIAAEGVGDSRYMWHGSGTNYTSGIHSHDCGIQISDPVVRDLGFWRCGIETEGESYYAFGRVLAQWLIRDPEVAAAVISKPRLRADRELVMSMAEDSVTLSCSIEASIRYCYFRARNGTIFNVRPSAPHDFATYVGAGLDAGECGIRFPRLAESDNGGWSCHVGLLNPEEDEQLARITVFVREFMQITQRRENDWMLLEGQIIDNRDLEYCRFVRIDGEGFTHAHMPRAYHSRTDLSRGTCGLSITNPTTLDLHPWIIVAKIRGQESEVSRTTAGIFDVPGGGGGATVIYRFPGLWIMVMTIGMSMILLAGFIGPKKNRQWTYERATAIRNSFTKKAVPAANVNNANTTAVAA